MACELPGVVGVGLGQCNSNQLLLANHLHALNGEALLVGSLHRVVLLVVWMCISEVKLSCKEHCRSVSALQPTLRHGLHSRRMPLDEGLICVCMALEVFTSLPLLQLLGAPSSEIHCFQPRPLRCSFLGVVA
jgi:hypothetical protein